MRVLSYFFPKLGFVPRHYMIDRIARQSQSSRFILHLAIRQSWMLRNQSNSVLGEVFQNKIMKNFTPGATKTFFTKFFSRTKVILNPLMTIYCWWALKKKIIFISRIFNSLSIIIVDQICQIAILRKINVLLRKFSVDCNLVFF